MPDHIVYRENPMRLLKGFALVQRLRKMQFAAVAVCKHELTLKILLGILVIWPNEILLLKGSANHTMVQNMTSRELVQWLLKRRQKFHSFLIAVLPMLVLLLQLPCILIKFSSWSKKKALLRDIFLNLRQGPLADSPWLFMWLQVAMAHAFVFGGRKKQRPQRILVIRIDHIGDNVNTIPLVRAIRSDCPNAHITILCDSSAFIWDNCPYIDEVLLYKTNNPFLNRSKKRLRWIFRPFTFYPRLRRRRFDLVLDPVGRTETHILSYLCMSARRIANSYYPYGLYDIEVPLRHYQTDAHEAIRALALWQDKNTITNDDRRLESWLTDIERADANRCFTSFGIAEGERRIGIHPGAMSKLRLWDIERFAYVAHTLHNSQGFRVVYFEPPDLKFMTTVFLQKLEKLGSSASVLRTENLRMLMALIAKCNIFLCVDSGPMHLAAAVNVPTVAIFGPGEYWRWQPLHSGSKIVRHPLYCAPCSQDSCQNPKCMSAVSADDVISTCKGLLETSKSTVIRA